MPLLLTHRESDLDGRDHFRLRAVQQRGPIYPLADGCARRLNEQRMSADQLHIPDEPVRANDNGEANRSLDARLSGQRRVNRIDTPDQLPFLCLSIYPDARALIR